MINYPKKLYMGDLQTSVKVMNQAEEELMLKEGWESVESVLNRMRGLEKPETCQEPEPEDEVNVIDANEFGGIDLNPDPEPEAVQEPESIPDPAPDDITIEQAYTVETGKPALYAGKETKNFKEWKAQRGE